MCFNKFRDKINAQAHDIMKLGHLFKVKLEDKDQLWEAYLAGWDNPEEKQYHNCNSCKSFIRQFGNVVGIRDGKIISVWDTEVEDEFKASVENMRRIIHNSSIESAYFTTPELSSISKKSNVKMLEDGTAHTWNHLYADVESRYVSEDAPSKASVINSAKDVLERGLNEISMEALETTLELIDDNTLYRGKEFRNQVEAFQRILFQYRVTEDKNTFLWYTAATLNHAVTHFKNSVIGTLVYDMSTGTDTEDAVKIYESKVAPHNYKRPKAVVTKSQIASMKEALDKEGYLNSLNRRFASPHDIPATKNLYVHRTTVKQVDIFDEIESEVTINPRKYQNSSELDLTEFVSNLKDISDIEVLVENKHMKNFVSLITGDAPSMFKWDNTFSWAYTGGTTDSIKEKVKQAGGNVNGIIRVSLSWSNHDDLDLHVIEPNGHRIFYRDKKSGTSGHLDVDMNAHTLTKNPVENIIWTNEKQMLSGPYKVQVNNFSKRQDVDTGFTVEIECNGEVFNWDYKVNPRHNQTENIVVFNWNKDTGIKFGSATKSEIVGKEKWGITTNRFYPVEAILNSPNHWDSNSVGNKHFIFYIKDMVNDENPRGFFNEYIKPDLVQNHKRGLEVLGSRIKVETTPDQVSGIGFSETKPDTVIVKYRQNNQNKITKLKIV